MPRGEFRQGEPFPHTINKPCILRLIPRSAASGFGPWLLHAFPHGRLH
jgi:hypothetical protein